MLVFVTTIVATFLFQSCSNASTYPPAKTQELNAARGATSLLPTSPSLLNASTLTTHTYPIHCYREGDVHTSLEGCRPTINQFRSFPAYRTRQLFRMGRFPLLPRQPPFILHYPGADCAIGVACVLPFRDDLFSWEQVRAAALAVAAECEDSYGYGGWTSVGQGMGWDVRVLGWVEDAGGANGTVVGEEVDGMASTILVSDS